MKIEQLPETLPDLTSEQKPPSDGTVRCPVKLQNYEASNNFQDNLHNTVTYPVPCKPGSCLGSVMNPVPARDPATPYTKPEVYPEAQDFLRQYYDSIEKLDSREHQTRLRDVQDTISLTGTYEHTYDELVFAAKTAWRNAPRCIGRQQWHKLEVFDHRHITTAQEMFDALCHHLKFSTNAGNIIPTLTAFPQRKPEQDDLRLWNTQLIRYAGYLQPDGTVIGDPAGVSFTEACQVLGWKGKGGRFDVLPLVIEVPGNEPEWFEFPSDIVMQVKLIHPKYDWFAELGLQWFVLPAVSGMMMDAGGIQYPSLPFSGWYMSTEVGTRDLCDVQRYNIAYEVAGKMGLDTSNNTTLWKDKVLIECNIAVLHSFQRAGATIQDHHTLSESFMRHFKQETQLRGGCPSDWVWIVPPMSSSMCTVYHQEMVLYNLKPGYFWQNYPWEDFLKQQRRVRSCSFWKMLIPAMRFYGDIVVKLRNSRSPCKILYASESGRAEAFARRMMATMDKMFRASVCLMEDYNVEDFQKEKFVLFVTSTYGSGDPPQNGKAFFKRLKRYAETCSPKMRGEIKQVRYSVFGLGSQAYHGTYCQFAQTLNVLLQSIGATQIASIGLGDELNHQEQSFIRWANNVTRKACNAFDITKETMTGVIMEEDTTDTWSASTFRTVPAMTGYKTQVLQALGKVHRKELHVCSLKSRKQLQSNGSSRQTIQINLDLSGSPKLKYKAGDHVGVLPANEKQVVDFVLARIVDCPSPDNAVTLEFLQKHEWKEHSRLPTGLTMRDALTYMLDLTSPPTQKLLQLMASVAKDDQAKERLVHLSNDLRDYTKWKHYYWPNLPEVLSQFPSIELPSSLVLSEFPVLQPRLYSISSSQLSYSKEVHLTMGVTKYRTQEGRGPVHKGVTTNYLNQLKEGENVTIFFRESEEFHLPADSMAPILLVGAGSGIAPLRAFWQEKYAALDKRQPKNGKTKSSGDHGEITLFFGCRTPKEDDIYAEEIKLMEKKGVITKTFKAYSRVKGKEKVYVQEMVRQQDHLVYQSLVNEDGHLYICGSTDMAVGVKQALKDIIQNYQQVAAPEAEEVIQTLKDRDQIHEDIFGGNDHQLPGLRKQSMQMEKAMLKKLSRYIALEKETVNYTDKKKEHSTLCAIL